MTQLPIVSESEAIVLEALWQENPLTSERIIELVAAREGWTPSTVKTLITRLGKKGAITSIAEGRRFFYRPLLSRDDYLTHVSRSLLDRLFEGRVAPLVSHFSQHSSLSARDIAELRQVLKELDND